MDVLWRDVLGKGERGWREEGMEGWNMLGKKVSTDGWRVDE